jgi:MITF/TFEB/TFEC/TFE3 N-terminus
LENPTRYHVIQKQKNQVRQYLSESLQTTGVWGDTTTKPASVSGSLSNLQIGSLNHNMKGDNNGQHHQQQQQKQQHQKSQMKPHSIDYHSISIGTSSTDTGRASGSSVPFFVQNNGSYVSPTEPPMSPGMSSVATSASEVSPMSSLLRFQLRFITDIYIHELLGHFMIILAINLDQ